MTEKPLHVRVAEALGCAPKMRLGGRVWDCECKENDHAEHKLHDDCHDGEGLNCDEYLLARYDTDWSATGPLIEKYDVWLQPCEDHRTTPGVACRGWVAVNGDISEEGAGATPLEAVCNLILALKAAGKLEVAA